MSMRAAVGCSLMTLFTGVALAAEQAPVADTMATEYPNQKIGPRGLNAEPEGATFKRQALGETRQMAQ